MLEFVLNINLKNTPNYLSPTYINTKSLEKEVYSVDKLRSYARTLAHVFKSTNNTFAGKSFVEYKIDNAEEVISNGYKKFLDVLSQGKLQLPSTAEWIIDNFYIVEEQFRRIKSDWKPGVYKNLPVLTVEPYLNMPRVYGIAQELVSHTDNIITEETLVEYLNYYQRVSPLSTVEIWALPNMLKICLLENIKFLVYRDLENLQKQQQARGTAEDLVNMIKKHVRLDNKIGRLFPSQQKLDTDFIVYFLQSLREVDVETTQITQLVEEKILEQDINIDEFIRTDINFRAANKVSVGNAITSIRNITSLPWEVLFEEISPVEKLLRLDPGGIYTQMDFGSRDRYRHVIETLSKQSRISETEIVRRILDLARHEKEETPGNIKAGHVGYYLINNTGLTKLKAQIPYEPDFKNRLIDFIRIHPRSSYFLSLTGTLALMLSAIYGTGVYLSIGADSLFYLVTFSAVIMSTPAISLVNTILSSILPPSPPPKIDLKAGIPSYAKTAIVVPTLIRSREKIDHLISNIEKHYLANLDENIFLAILSDYTDAKEKNLDGDSELLEYFKHEIQKLNDKYNVNNPFYLLHRDRVFNPKENKWMGWERKRGKLIEFNRFISGDQKTTYTTVIGDIEKLKEIKYVITLDEDTELPIGCARKLVGGMIHPLNEPVIDQKRKVVIEGYGIIQPLVSIQAPSAVESWFSKSFVRESGVDAYSGIVSEVYQDLLGSSIFSGKAIYSVHAYRETIQERFPENHLLSHDLIEGAYMRVGLASDVEVLEDYPSGLISYLLRQHRWIRGDWQILEWLLPFVPNYKNRLERNPLSLTERWKIFDNLRRSIHPIFLVTLLFISWLGSPGFMQLATAVFLVSLLAGPFSYIFNIMRFRPIGEPFFEYAYIVIQEKFYVLFQSILRVTFSLHQAYINIDAIFRVLFRKYISRKKLLEWTTQQDVQKAEPQTLLDYIGRMWISPLLSVLFGSYLFKFNPVALEFAAPFLSLWLLAPLIAYLVSKKIIYQTENLSETEKESLHSYAGKIWRFYDEFASTSENHLPADNFQQSPGAVIAHRTSPTNIGMYMLSAVSAYDLGYLSTGEFADKIKLTFTSISKLLKYNGHLYNWYDTQTLQPLNTYISTVDSGNFIASLIVLRQSCLEISETGANLSLINRGLVGILNNLKESLEINIKFISPLSDIAEEQYQDSSNQDTENKFQGDIEKLLAEVKQWKSDELFNPDDRINILYSYKEKFHMYMQELSVVLDDRRNKEIQYWLEYFYNHISRFENEANIKKIPSKTRNLLLECAKSAEKIITQTDFKFLYNEKRKIFHIGWIQSENRHDSGYYDLLASEARIASYLAIAFGHVPPEHWFRLSRPLTRVGRTPTLLSWGGTMFEYLTPTLFIKDYQNTLIDETIKGITRKQCEYGFSKNIPWGISESAFFAFDFLYNYQYRMFGIPELSLKVELTENLVVSPYSTFLALPYLPKKSFENLKKLKNFGAYGSYGFYEAVDFTKSRLQGNQNSSVIYSYFAHHQGMSILALNNYLNQDIIRNRFHRDPHMASAELVLQEKVPLHVSSSRPVKEEKKLLHIQPKVAQGGVGRNIKTPHTVVPRMGILSNGDYSVLISNTGSSHSKYKGTSINLYKEDATLDNKGIYFYIKDEENSNLWSATYQPTTAKPEKYECSLSLNSVEFQRQDYGIASHLEIYVPPNKNLEIRKLSLTNLSKKARQLEVTTYSEVALDTHKSVAAHPAFSKLFIESSFSEDEKTLIFRRRPRSEEQAAHFAFHTIFSDNGKARFGGFETDRYEFIGRGRTENNPRGVHEELKNTQGAVLDPIMCMRQKLFLNPGESATLICLTGYAESKDEALKIVSELSSTSETNRQQELARIYSQIELQHLGVSEEHGYLYQQFASRIIYPDTSLRASAQIVASNVKGQSGLWGYGISGDNKIVLVKARQQKDLKLVKEMLLAHEYLRLRGFTFDLVLLVDNPLSYNDELSEQIQSIIETSLSRPWVDKPGGIFLRKSDAMPTEDLILLQSASRVILDGDFGDLNDHIKLVSRTDILPPPEGFYSKQILYEEEELEDASYHVAPSEMSFVNGFGNFSHGGEEYIINLTKHENTPLPWSNVISNGKFGTLLTESGLGYTWYENAQLNKITPWSNDPVKDTPGEAIYIKDEVSGNVYSPTPLPIRDSENYLIRHGKGYSIYEHECDGISQKLVVFVPMDAPVKIISLTIRNNSKVSKTLSATMFAEWVLGTNFETSKDYVITKFDKERGTIFATNPYNEDYRNNVSFLACNSEIKWATSSRREFLGRNGAINIPQSLINKGNWSGNIEVVTFDPCGALETKLVLEPNQEKEIIFLLGQAENRWHAEEIIDQYKRPKQVRESFNATRHFWKDTLNKISINTPNHEMNTLVNEWLPYQVLSCRFWGRTSFYQAGGAYGFRDQLQDSLALIYANPALTREQILNSARHQFVEGDVMHWWHAPKNKGVRTKISDDLLWLPYVTSEYIKATGDKSVLKETIPYLKMPVLNPDQEDLYGEPEVSDITGTIYDHCLRAINHSLRFGEHGMPLIGTGDWNDGLNSVGNEGKGESVWLGWFLYTVLSEFSNICEIESDKDTRNAFESTANKLKLSLNTNTWDGNWYKRAWFDSGKPLGSRENEECFIDSISQSWAVISKAGDPEKAQKALESAEEHLVKEEDKTILLLTPPFNHTHPHPGYIQGYIPGIRENGGQYTHAAIWFVIAQALAGNNNKAMDLFDMINPINHTKNPEATYKYKAEPYVIAADVYSNPLHKGRAGWSWYTGSASWMYRAAIEYILGFKLMGDHILIEPNIPDYWDNFQITYHHGNTKYFINVINKKTLPKGSIGIKINGTQIPGNKIPLSNEQQEYMIEVELGDIS